MLFWYFYYIVSFSRFWYFSIVHSIGLKILYSQIFIGAPIMQLISASVPAQLNEFLFVPSNVTIMLYIKLLKKTFFGFISFSVLSLGWTYNYVVELRDWCFDKLHKPLPLLIIVFLSCNNSSLIFRASSLLSFGITSKLPKPTMFSVVKITSRFTETLFSIY